MALQQVHTVQVALSLGLYDIAGPVVLGVAVAEGDAVWQTPTYK